MPMMKAGESCGTGESPENPFLEGQAGKRHRVAVLKAGPAGIQRIPRFVARLTCATRRNRLYSFGGDGFRPTAMQYGAFRLRFGRNREPTPVLIGINHINRPI